MDSCVAHLFSSAVGRSVGGFVREVAAEGRRLGGVGGGVEGKVVAGLLSIQNHKESDSMDQIPQQNARAPE